MRRREIDPSPRRRQSFSRLQRLRSKVLEDPCVPEVDFESVPKTTVFDTAAAVARVFLIGVPKPIPNSTFLI